MTKILLILVIASIVESAGIAILSGGLKEIHGATEISASQIARVIKDGACNRKVLLGIALEAAFFGALLYMLSVRDVSFVWPLTSLGFIVTALAAQFLLNETVSPVRWAGVLCIALGAALISSSEASKKPDSPPPAAVDSTSLRPQ
jgi:drug/metabolite transporter (DMT)-like permease